MTNLSGTNLHNGAAVGPQGEGRESPSRFPAYPVYKDSCVEWLGPVPATWRVVRTFHLGICIRTGKVDVNIQEEDGLYPFFTCSKDAKRSKQFSFDCEALLVAGNGEVGYTQYYKGKFEAYQRTYVLSDFGGMNARFLQYHFMENLVVSVKGKSIGSVIQFITLNDLRGFPVPVPSQTEQTRIARFLDYETARIDALIEEQQRLIELLKEKRQAIISHAVTKGLDPTVPMKDSGVEWLGEVPAHWEVGSLRRLIKSVGNGTTADQVDEAEDTVAVSRIETISAGLIDFEKVGHVGPQDVAKRFLLNVGDILFSHINSLSMVGNVAIYSGGRQLLHGMNLLRIQPLPSISSEWLLYWLKSKNVRQEVESRAKPAINQASISTDSVRALPALIPPSFEQTQIARFLDHETARIDALIEEANSGVGLLQERRSALISAAVTGKIDVRGWQPPVSTQAPELAVAEAV